MSESRHGSGEGAGTVPTRAPGDQGHAAEGKSAFHARLVEGRAHLVTGLQEMRIGLTLIGRALAVRLVELAVEGGAALVTSAAARAGGALVDRCPALRSP